MSMTSPSSIDAQLRAARAAMDDGNAARADAACRAVLEREPDNAAALHLLGRIAMQAGRGPEALDLLRRAVASDPALAAAHGDLGRLLAGANQLDAAAESLRAAIAIRPTDADLSDLGYVLNAAGRPAEAVDVLRRALQLNPTHVLAHCNLGAAHRALKNFAAAAAHYAKAAALRPKMIEAHLFEGVAAAEAGDLAKARSAWERVKRLGPSPRVLSDIGALLARLGHHREALPYLQSASQSDPNDVPTLRRLAVALRGAGKLSESETALRRAIALGGPFPGAQLELGVVLHRQDKLDAAAAAFEEHLRGDPASAIALANLGDVRSLQGRVDEAIELSNRAIAADPSATNGYKNQSIALMRALRMTEALEAAQRGLAAATTPEARADMNVVLALAMLETGQIEAAVGMLRDAIALTPGAGDLNLRLGILLLGLGRLEEGFAEYEHREKPEPIAGLRPWTGQRIDGSTLMLRSEQGFGDTIHFIRYAPMARQRSGAARIIAAVPEALRGLVERAPGVDRVLGELSADAGGARFEVSLLSLPHILGTTLDTIPANVPYLFAPEKPRNPKLAETIGTSSDGAPQIGLVWAGNPKYGNDRRRSVPIEMLRPMVAALAPRGGRFFSLQVGAAATRDAAAMAELGIVSLADCLTDFAETAWTLNRLDLLVTVDTAIAHLAGALARPVWVMLPFAPDWRWLRDRDDSVWYPTMRLFRQRAIGDWKDVIDRIARELGALGK